MGQRIHQCCVLFIYMICLIPINYQSYSFIHLFWRVFIVSILVNTWVPLPTCAPSLFWNKFLYQCFRLCIVTCSWLGKCKLGSVLWTTLHVFMSHISFWDNFAFFNLKNQSVHRFLNLQVANACVCVIYESIYFSLSISISLFSIEEKNKNINWNKLIIECLVSCYNALESLLIRRY